MTLLNLLPALAGNTNLFITLVDKTGSELITFKAAGYASVESDLGIRGVLSITLDSPNTATIKIDDE